MPSSGRRGMSGSAMSGRPSPSVSRRWAAWQPGLDDQPGVASAPSSRRGEQRRLIGSPVVADLRAEVIAVREVATRRRASATTHAVHDHAHLRRPESRARRRPDHRACAVGRHAGSDPGRAGRPSPSSSMVTSSTGPVRSRPCARGGCPRRSASTSSASCARWPPKTMLRGYPIRSMASECVSLLAVPARTIPATAARTRARGSAASRRARSPVITSCTSQSRLRCVAAARPAAAARRRRSWRPGRSACAGRSRWRAGSPGRAPASPRRTG